MSGSRKRTKTHANKAKRNARSSNTGLCLGASASDSDGNADSEELDAVSIAGSAPTGGQVNIDADGRRFKRWLAEMGHPLEQIRDQAPRDRSGRPEVPWLAVVAWLDDIMRVKPEIGRLTMRNYVSHVRRFLKLEGWDTAAWTVWKPVLHSMIANHRRDDPESHIRRTARPVTGSGPLELITDSIDALRDDDSLSPMWVEALRTFHLLTCYLGFRATETTCRLRWGWITFAEESLEILTPGGHVLKRQATEKVIEIPQHPTDPGYCPVEQLWNWKRLCEEHGIPTGPDDTVLPLFQKSASPRVNPRSFLFPDGEPFRANPVEALTSHNRWRPDQRSDLRHDHAERYVSGQYMRSWTRVALSSGFEPRSAYESISSHGMRRGRASTMKANGAHVSTIQSHLRQADRATTAIYVDTHDAPSPDTRDLLPHVTADRTEVPTSPPETAVQRRCAVSHESDLCSEKFAGHVTRDGVVIAVCEDHRRKHNRGAQGTSFTAPVKRRRGATTPRCGVSDSPTCPNPYVEYIEIDGLAVMACAAHAQLSAEGATGVELTGPVHAPKSLCEMLHHGDRCDGDATARILLDDTQLHVCAAHKDRFRSGKRGDELTAPIKRWRPPPTECAMPHEGLTCGGKYKSMIDFDGGKIPACAAHVERTKRGLTGPRLTRPIASYRR